MKFSHPLARAAKVYGAATRDGKELRTLVIVTTLTLESQNKRYNPKLVERLSAAAQEFVEQSKDVAAYVFVNRPRDWQD